MKIHIADEVLEYENDRGNIAKIFDEINIRLSSSSLILSHLIIDGYELYSDFYDYILENVKYIEEIQVVTRTSAEMAQEIMLSKIDYIERARPQIGVLSDEFYKTPSKDSWNKLIDLLGGIRWIIDAFTSIDLNPQLKNIVGNYEQWNLYAQDVLSLGGLVEEFEEVLENNDLVSVADILSYEIVPIFGDMKEKLEKLMEEKVEQ